LVKYLREKPRGSKISRRQMYEAEKRKRGGNSLVGREEIRKTGRSSQIVIDDLTPGIINNSINMLVMKNKETDMEEEHMERALALLLERAKEEKLRQKAYTHRVVKSNLHDKEELVGNVLRYQAINKNETFLPDTLRYKSKNGEQRTIALDDEDEVVSYSVMTLILMIIEKVIQVGEKRKIRRRNL
jgi:hypothetical protein